MFVLDLYGEHFLHPLFTIQMMVNVHHTSTPPSAQMFMLTSLLDTV